MEYTEVCLVYKEDEDYKIERVYAEPFNNYYVVKGVPAFAHGVAFEDVVSVEKEGEDIFVDKVIKQSGHSVLHIVILKPEKSAYVLATLATHNTYINYLHNNLYLVIDVPTNTSYKRLREYLKSEVNKGNIEVEEACVSDIHEKLID